MRSEGEEQHSRDELDNDLSSGDGCRDARGDLGGLGGIGDAEADADGDVGGLFDDGDLFGDASCDFGLGAGDAEAGNVVDEAFGAASDLGDALGW